MNHPLTHTLHSDRIVAQKNSVKTLVTLYANSTDHAVPPSQSSHGRKTSTDPKQLFKMATRAVRTAATTTTTALGNVASEIAGRSGVATKFIQYSY